jgi:predicted lipoprotein with Yx(FWY)xxD motif
MNLVRPKFLAPLVAALIVLSALFAFGASAQTLHRPAAAAKLVQVIPGHLIVNSKGFPLYVLGADAPNKSNCTGLCAKYWPPAIVPAGVTPPVHVKGATGTFGILMRANGKHQLTYDSAPLYTFLNDKKPTDLNGEGVYAFHGFWFPVLANRK